MEDEVAGLDLLVQNPEAPDDLGVEVREQGIGDRLFFAELTQDLLVVVGDRVEGEAGGLEALVGVAQLAELRPTRGSPDRGAIEDDDRGASGAVRMEVDGSAVGIGEHHVGQAVADFGARRLAGREAGTPGVAERGRCVEAQFVSLDRHQSPPRRSGISPSPLPICIR
jgi:hypothetical protein